MVCSDGASDGLPLTVENLLDVRFCAGLDDSGEAIQHAEVEKGKRNLQIWQ
jgi:hypothetical protein